jgi:ATP-dependent DNA helicase RecG
LEDFFDSKIEFLKGVGPKRAELLQKELEISTFGDLLFHFPFRFEDRSKITEIKDITGFEDSIQVIGTFSELLRTGYGRKKRLEALFSDSEAEIKINWFSGVDWIEKKIHRGEKYLLYGKPSIYKGKISISHPEFEVFQAGNEILKSLVPIYHSNEKLRNYYLNGKSIGNLVFRLVEKIPERILDPIPLQIREKLKLISKREALINIHFPKNLESLRQARRRLKFEELFLLQVKSLHSKQKNLLHTPGRIFNNTKTLAQFYKLHLPFSLTDSQKKVMREIFNDLKSGFQMNRLLQGDVGSGKTIIAFLAALLAKDQDSQSCLMAPTEILANQHYEKLTGYGKQIGLRIRKLTGSTPSSARKNILEELEEGKIDLIIGTHALIEDRVKFKDLTLCIIDEQHRFGVAQRARLWKKSSGTFPHILVMTATPIPRTLALTFYAELDVSVIDELPAGRKPIITKHATDRDRIKVFSFLRKQIEIGGQIYIVYPLIEESRKLEYKDLMDGYESISRAFPKVPLSILHGQMKPEAKEFEMARFVKGETKIMVSTTVIEVGLDVPNASIMVIENAEKFGLAQLHQLRGRVGRGSKQSYCLMISGEKLSEDAKTRIRTMVQTNDGFKIAEVDLQLRGPGDLAGLQQSGPLNLKIANLSTDAPILIEARKWASFILEKDPDLSSAEYQFLAKYLSRAKGSEFNWRMVG